MSLRRPIPARPIRHDRSAMPAQAAPLRAAQRRAAQRKLRMQDVFSTDHVHARDRFGYWHEVACRNLVAHESWPESRLGFRAAIRAGALGDMGLVAFENSPMDIVRTPRQAGRASSDELFICRQLTGRLALEQNGREVVLQPGDITLLDPLLPYLGKFFSGSGLLVLKVPRAALEARLGQPRDLVACAVPPSSPEANLASSFLALLPDCAGRIRPVADDLVKDQALDLVAVALAHAAQAHRPKLSSAASLALLNVRAAIEARLADPALDADA